LPWEARAVAPLTGVSFREGFCRRRDAEAQRKPTQTTIRFSLRLCVSALIKPSLIGKHLSEALKREVGLRDLILFNVSAVLGLRWLATAAHTGPHSLTLWVLALLMFFVPQSLTVVELARRFPDEGGIYDWTKRAFGPFHGFLCGWSYWISNLAYFPTVLISGVVLGAYIGGPRGIELSKSTTFTSALALTLMVIATVMCVAGTAKGKWLANIGGLAIWAPGSILCFCGLVSWSKFGSATAITAHSLIPKFDMSTVNFWSQQAFAFAGLELAPIMAGEIRNPEKNVPRAALISGLSIALIYIAGTAAVMAIIPPAKVDLMAGPVQAIDDVARRYGFHDFGGAIGLLMAVGSLGGAAAWLAGSARLPFVAGLDRFLPPSFGKLHPRWGTPYIAILSLAVPAIVLLALGFFGGTVAETFVLLADMTLLLYFVPFLYMFAAMIRFRPGVARTALAGLGAFTTLVAVVLAFIPPAEAANKVLFIGKLAGGTLAFFGVGVWLYGRRPAS
jgi:amino acid transporter